MMRSDISRLFVLGAIVAFGMSCAVKTMDMRQYGHVKDCDRCLLIASEKSEFKSAVIDHITRELSDEFCYIKLVDIDDIVNEPEEKYEAIAVMNSLLYLRINKNAREFIDITDNNEKFVMLVTVGKKGRIHEVEGIDAVSSASIMEDADEIADYMVSSIRGILEGG